MVRLMHDFCLNPLRPRYCQNLLEQWVERKTEKADLVTAFEVFGNIVNPVEELNRLRAIAPNVLFSTELIVDLTPKRYDWPYCGKEHGQHIEFFRIRTLERLARERGKFLVSNGTLYHLITDKLVNQAMRRLMIKINRFMSFILRRTLAPKFWFDHNLLACVNK